jgi:hypothetical protein
MVLNSTRTAPHRKNVASGHFVLREAKESFHWPKCEPAIFLAPTNFVKNVLKICNKFQVKKKKRRNVKKPKTFIKKSPQ